jgi:hypothetical protein
MLSSLLGIRWLPYAAGLGLVLFLVWRTYDAGYDSGYNTSQAIVQEAEAATMRRHIAVAQQVATIDLEAVIVTAQKKELIRYAITKIVRTTEPCDSADWLREYNEVVRAAGTDGYSW